MSYPKKVYALFPLNEKCDVAGVYIGSTENPKVRLKCHRNNKRKNDSQSELHDLMRANGYSFIVLDEIETPNENHIEYDWVDYFLKKTSLRVFNNITDVCDANWTRINIEPKRIPLIIPELSEGFKISYPMLKAIMKEKKLSLTELSAKTGIRYNTLSEKLRGNSVVYLNEALAIKQAVGTDIPLEVLFEKKEVRE